jgi:ABC-type branched-subunit amino acid transport system ATPase component
MSTNPLDELEDVEQTREQLRDEARRQLGVTGTDEKTPPLRESLARHNVGTYPLAVLGTLLVVDTLHAYGFTVLAPEISRSLGVGKGAIAGVLAFKTLALSLAPLPIAALVQRKPRRALLSVLTGMIWSAASVLTAFVLNVWSLLGVLAIDGLTSGSVGALHSPLLLDSYPPEARVRALTYYGAAGQTANIFSPLAVALLAGAMNFTWRGVFLILGVVSLAATFVGLRLRDPGFGRFDTKKIRETVHELHHDDAAISDDDVSLGFFEIVRRLLVIPTVRRLLMSYAVLGILLIPFQTFLFFFLEERWGLGPGGRGLVFAVFATASVTALALFGKRGEALFRRNPGRVVEVAGVILLLAVVLICLAALSPVFGLMIVLMSAAFALLAIITPSLDVAILSVIPSHMRPHTAALTGIFNAGVGGLIGALFLSGIDRRFGIGGSIVSLLVPGVVGALILRSAGKLVPQDLDRMIDEVLEEEEINRINSSGGRLPMLACRHVDFSYGQLQVLFGVDFTVDDGEMVALLGVNGAGKSTLLKVISGIGLPSTGSVRYRGADITFLDAERRVRLGITQVPGGRAVFGPMSVVENLRSFGYTLGRDRRGLDTAIDSCFEAFPRLAERRNQLASTLSGGEQQMLGLSKALILQPRLLLIDELSLGLAPVIVGQLLEMVRHINEQGTAVVLVEQSVNIALGLVGHAYFMEKGEIRFDGPSRELLARDDLLRAVFLEGAGKQTNGKRKK